MLITAAVVVMAAGVTHAYLRNSHVEVMRAIDKTEQRMKDHDGVVNSLQVKIDKKLNIYQLREDLELAGSGLVTVPSTAIERISAHTLAEATDGATSIASINP